MTDDNEATKQLQTLLDNKDEEEFIRRIREIPSLINCKFVDRFTKIEKTLLQYCCTKNLIEAAGFLIKKGASLTEAAPDTMAPLEIACFHGRYTLLNTLIQKLLLETAEADEKMKDAVCKAIISLMTGYQKNDDYQRCLDKLVDLVKIKKIDINRYKQKIIFFSTSLGRYDLLFKLSYKLAFHPVAPSDLEKIFDLCIDTGIDMKEKSPKASITFNYDNLCTEENCTSISKMDYLRIVIYDDKYKNLLLHPLVMCFLLLKWLKIKHRFYIHFAIYIIQMAIFVTLTFINPTGNDSMTLTNLLEGVAIMISIVDVIYGITMWWKFFKTWESSKKYWVLLKMYLYHILLPLAVIISVIICFTYENTTAKKILFIPLSIVAFRVILLSRVITIYGELFLVVLCNCVKILTLMVPLFAVVSGIYFSTLNSSLKNSTNDFVATLVTVSYNLFVLLIGELEELEDEPFNRTIYMIFILLFSIVCANLLNALVIFDTNQLKSDALQANQREIARYIYLYEIVFGDFDMKNCKKIEGFLNKSFDNEILNKKPMLVKVNQNIIESLNSFARRTNNISIFHCVIIVFKHSQDSAIRQQW